MLVCVTIIWVNTRKLLYTTIKQRSNTSKATEMSNCWDKSSTTEVQRTVVLWNQKRRQLIKTQQQKLQGGQAVFISIASNSESSIEDWQIMEQKVKVTKMKRLPNQSMHLQERQQQIMTNLQPLTIWVSLNLNHKISVMQL